MKHIFHIFYVIMTYLIIYSYVPLYAEDISEEEYAEIASKFYSWEKGNENDSLLRQQIKVFNVSRALESYSQNHEYSIPQDGNNQTYIEKILIIVKNNVYSSMPSYVIRYAHDIHNAYGCTVDIVSVSGETAPQIRSLIQAYSTDLNGVVLIGDIIPAFYYHGTAPTWEEETFPCDLFFMDIDGTWQLMNDGSGIYDGHTGNVAPEIFVGRINTATMGRNEIPELKWYFDKNHQFYMGQKVLNKQRAATFTYSDWDDVIFRTSVSPLYGSNYYDAVHGSAFNKANYCTYLQDTDYEFIQLACHSSSIHHNFKTTLDNILYQDKIDSLYTKQIGYNLFCCHACDWTDYDTKPCLGESYLYGMNNNSSTLALVGSTKTGGMLMGMVSFYTPLGNGKCIGYSFKNWWVVYCGPTHTGEQKRWYYGMVILGDPLIDFNFTNDCDDILYLNGGEEATSNMYYAQSRIEVQNYSITQGQSVTLSAPNIQINGPFLCNPSSSFIATPFDSCICNTTTRKSNLVSYIHSSRISSRWASNYEITAYPNPARNEVTIECPAAISEVSFINIEGQVLLRTNQSQIDISALPQGLYIVQAVTENGEILTTKIIHN